MITPNKHRDLRIALMLSATPLLLAAADATAQQRPHATAVSTIGPWEAVLWTVGGRVDHCTLIRAAAPAEGPHYGFLVDRGAKVLSVAAKWQVPAGGSATAAVKPATGAERRLPVAPSAPGRANMDVDNALLSDLQKSAHLDVKIGEVSVRLAFDDFNPARVVLESCVQKIGAEFKAEAPAR